MLDQYFDHNAIDFNTLKEWAFNQRWAEQEAGVIPLTAADPDFKVAPEITQALNTYISKGYFSYGPALGYESFKQAVSNWYRLNHRGSFESEDVVGFNSAAEALDQVAAVIFEQGGEALIPDPVDFLFQTSIERNGGSVQTFGFELDSGRLDWSMIEGKATQNTKAIYICNPNNPAGTAIHSDDLALLVELCRSKGWYLVSDEIWLDIWYDNTPLESLAPYCDRVSDRFIIISGLSKNFGLAGLRIGYTLCKHKSINQAIIKNSGHNETIGGLSTLSQIAATTAFNQCGYWLELFRKHLEAQRDYLIQRMDQMPGFSIRRPVGTYLAFIQLPPLIDESKECADIKAKAKVALVPGSPRWFGPAAAGHLRLCFATSKETLKEALDRLALYAEQTFK